MKLYLAAKYGQMMEMREVAARLRKKGHEITSQWIDGKEKSDAGAGIEVMIAGALMDYRDVLRADILVAFSQERGTLHTGGGRHVEFGIALQAGKPIIIVGPKGEHIFHHIPNIMFVDNVDQLIERLR